MDRSEVKKLIGIMLANKVRIFKSEVTDLWVENANLREQLDELTEVVKQISDYVTNKK